MHVQVLSFVLQRHHLLGFAGHGLEPPQASSCRPLGLLRRSESQQVVQVVGQVVGLWIINSERGETRTGAEDTGHSWTKKKDSNMSAVHVEARYVNAGHGQAGMLMQRATRHTCTQHVHSKLHIRTERWRWGRPVIM